MSDSPPKRYRWFLFGLILAILAWTYGRYSGYSDGQFAGEQAGLDKAHVAEESRQALDAELAETNGRLRLYREENEALLAAGLSKQEIRTVRPIARLEGHGAMVPAVLSGEAASLNSAGLIKLPYPAAGPGEAPPYASSPAGAGCVLEVSAQPWCRATVYRAGGRVMGSLEGRTDVAATLDGTARSYGTGWQAMKDEAVEVDESLQAALDAATRRPYWPRLELRAGVSDSGYQAGGSWYPSQGKLLRHVGLWAEAGIERRTISDSYLSASGSGLTWAVGVAARF